MGMKNSVFFTIDSLLASGIIIVSILLLSNFYSFESEKSNINYASRDLVRVFSTMIVGEIENAYVSNLTESGIITNSNNTILEQIGEFWAEDKIDLAKNFTRNITEEIIPKSYGFSVLVDGEEIYSRSIPIKRSLVSSRKIISGIAKAKPTKGFTARVLLDGIKSKKTSSYAYFGGYEGDGNITKKLILPNDVISFNSSYLEIDAGGNFDLYINNVFSGSYAKGSSGGGNMLADKWNISNLYLSNFKAGENNITVNFTSGSSYVAGGFLKLTYITSSYNDTLIPGYEKYYFPGIEGVINLYSSIYAPAEPSNMNISLHFLSQYQLYLNIGNITVFESDSSSNEQIVLINNSNLSEMLDYASLNQKTTPLRLGLRSSNITLAGKVADSVLITDRTASMSACDVTVNCTAGLCDSNPSGGCHDRRDQVAIQADKKFVDTVLQTTGSKVSLVGFGTDASPVCSFHDFSSDNVSLKYRISNYSSEWCGNTCISCGILAATELLTENEALYGLNQKFSVDNTQFHVGDTGSGVSVSMNLGLDVNKTNFIKSRLTVLGKGVDTENGYQSCIFLNGNYLGRMCEPHHDPGWHTCSYPLKPEWLVSGNGSYNSWMQTTQADFEAGTLANVNTTASPGDVIIGNGSSSGLTQLFYDNFDDNDISDYSTINGNWNTAAESGKGSVLRETDNSHTIIYQPALNFDQSYIVKAIMWNEDNDAAGVAFRVNTADADNFYSCSATADSRFNAGIWRHDNDITTTPTSNLAGNPWTYVMSRWYNITVILNETANTIRCIWESEEAGIEFDVTAADDDVRESGSVGIWTSYQDNFKGDLMSVWRDSETDGNSGTVMSQVYDAGAVVNWNSINWTEYIADNTNITFQVRTGSTPAPDSSWDNYDWSDSKYKNSNGTKIAQNPGRYIQWLATLQSKNASLYNPVLSDAAVNYTANLGSNSITITGGTTSGCFQTSGDNDDWDFQEVKLLSWESSSPPSISYDSIASEVQIGDPPKSEMSSSSMTINVEKSKMKSAMIEFEAIDINPGYFDCVYVNGNYIGNVDYQEWNETNVWQKILFDVPVAWLKNGANEVNITSGTTSGCHQTSGDNDDWRFRNLNLSVIWTNDAGGYDRNKAMLVMSDGSANTKIGDTSSSGAGPQAVEKACEAKSLYGISVYTVLFGDTANQNAIDTLNDSACCDDCSHFYTASNSDELIEIYSKIAQSVGNITFQAQSINISAGNLVRTVLYPDSYLSFNYSIPGSQFNKVPLTFETGRFGNNASTGTLSIYPNTSVSEAKVTSYSGAKWTSNLIINGNNVFNLSDYGANYLNLGDPFAVNIPAGSINQGDNSILISTGINSTDSSGGSNDSKAVYTLLLNGFSDYSSVVSKSDGCSWTVSFEDGSAATIKVPSNYNGADICSFSTSTYDSNDALDNAVFQLFSNLDLDKNGKLEVNIDENSLDVSSLSVSKVPSLWGPAIVEIRVWE